MKVISAQDILELEKMQTLQQSLISRLIPHQFRLKLSRFNIVTGYLIFQQRDYLTASLLSKK